MKSSSSSGKPLDCIFCVITSFEDRLASRVALCCASDCGLESLGQRSIAGYADLSIKVTMESTKGGKENQ